MPRPGRPCRCLIDAARPGSWPGSGGDTMKASDAEAAGRPALTRPGPAAGHPVTQQRHGRRRRLSSRAPAGARHTASAIAAALGRSRRQLTPACWAPASGRAPTRSPSQRSGRPPASSRRGCCGGPHLPREDTMPEPAAPRPDPGPATTRPRPSPNGTAPPKLSVPPMPWEVTNNGTVPPKPSVPPMPWEVTNNGTAPPKPSVPPMPSEVTNAHTRTRRPAAGVFRTAMSPLRKMLRRAPRHA